MKLKPILFIAVVILTAYACLKKPADPNLDIPKFTTELTFSNKTDTSMTLSWAATDAITPVADLSYKVVYSLTNNVSNLTDAEANGSVLQDWTINSLTANMSSLTTVTPYYVTVLVRDADGNTGFSTGSASTLCVGKIIFLGTVSNGNFGGPSGADTVCNSQKPTGFAASTFKALLTDGTSRRACYITGTPDDCVAVATNRAGWVLGASQIYCTSDYSVQIGTTSANAILTVPNTNTMASATTAVYSGFNTTWGSVAGNCAGFTSVSSTVILGSANGVEDGSGHSFINSGIGGCSGNGNIYCVEQ